MSGFGKGLTYCLGLFLMHAESLEAGKESSDRAALWFNGASDHLYEMQIPENLPEDLKSKLEGFQECVLDWGHGVGMNRPTATQKDVQWSLKTAMELLMEIDRLHGIEVGEADWK